MIGRCLAVISAASAVFLTANVLLSDEQLQEPLASNSGSNSAVVTQDIVYFYREFPIFMRLQLQIDGNPFEHAWVEHVQSLFAEIDSDGDGSLRPEEVAAISQAGNNERVRPMVGARTDGVEAKHDASRLVRDPDLWSADRSPFDRAITMDELRAFLVAKGRGPFQAAEMESGPVANDVVGTTLFRLLDENADRNLSAGELSAAITSLHRRDLDDDGTFGISELGAGSNPYVALSASAATDSTLPFVTLIPGRASIEVMRELERRYASAPPVAPVRRSTLSRDLRPEDLRLQADVFKQYDFDADGTLNLDELRELVRCPPPTLELIVRLGSRSDRGFLVELVGSAKGEKITLRRSADGLASIVINDVQIEIVQASNNPDVAKQYLLGQFGTADRDSNDYVDKAEAERNNTFQAAFDEFDEDGDGKMFREELTAVVDSRTRAARIRTRMDISDGGRSLFEILDVDRNRALGGRELTQAARRIELWDTDGDGAVSEAEIPQLYQISFGLGQPEFQGLRIPGQINRSKAETGSTISDVPKWFGKLDRNGDGELTRREFPGTLAEFQKFDQNSDGVLNTEEAALVEASGRRINPH